MAGNNSRWIDRSMPVEFTTVLDPCFSGKFSRGWRSSSINLHAVFGADRVCANARCRFHPNGLVVSVQRLYDLSKCPRKIDFINLILIMTTGMTPNLLRLTLKPPSLFDETETSN